MIVVSGCPRSGTSLMMDLLRQTFGEERIIGDKFPQEKKLTVQRHISDTDETFEFRTAMAIKCKDENANKLEISKDLNPNGFWECPFTVAGAGYRPNTANLIKRIENEEVPSICKIVSQGLAGTNPRYITKIIYMLREPTSVAKSQERLRREVKYIDDNGEVVNIWDFMDKISPKMFIEVTTAAALWMKAHPEVDVHFVEYSKLMSDPETTLLGIEEFLGEGDFKNAVGTINPKLNRSSSVTISHPLLEEAEMVFEKMKAMDWSGIEDYAADRKTLLQRQTRQWPCVRSGSIMQEGLCIGCVNDAKFRESLKDKATRCGIDWKSKPCAFECAFDVDRENYLSIEESIENNHWQEK